MLRFIEDILFSFRSCFSRRASFHWFVLVVVGFMLRGDQLGVTSIIRDLSLTPACYELLIHFFHSDAWEPSRIRRKWYEILAAKAPCWKVNGKTVLAGDGVKQYKEAFYMAGVKKLFQESENISKPEYIFGHLFGAVGLLAGNAEHCFCIPLRMNIQDGLKTAASWENSGILQLVSLSDTFAETVIEKRYLRTPSNKNPSEASVMYYLRRSFFVFLLNDPDSAITKIIRGRQDQPPGQKISRTG